MASPPAKTPHRRTRRVLAAGVAVGVLALASGGAVLWTQRSALGARLVVDALARRGVLASVHLTRLDGSGAEGSLAIGPAGDPDLVVPHLRISFAAWPPPGGGTPKVTAVVLDRPRLKARWDGRRLTFGALQPLVDDALAAKPGGPPGPDVTVRDGRLDLAAPAGPAKARGDVRLHAGRLISADLHVAAAAAVEHGWSARDLAGRIRAQADAERVKLTTDLTASSVHAPQGAARSARLRLDADLPYGRDAQSLLDGHVTADAVLRASSAQVQGAQLSDARVDTHFDGVLDRGGEHVVGAADATLVAAATSAAGNRLDGVRARMAAAAIDASAARGTAVARSPVTLQLSADSGEAHVGRERVRLDAVHLTGRGRAALRDGLRLQGDVGGSAHGGLDPAAAARLAAALAPDGWSDLRAALARSLAGASVSVPRVSVAGAGRDWRIALAAPAALAADGGARLAVTQASWSGAATDGRGRFAATLAGGGLPQVSFAAPAIALARGRLRAPGVSLALEGSAGPLRNARFALAGDVMAQGRRLAVRAARCTDVTLGAYLGDGGAPLARDLSARLCPAPAPLLESDAHGWRVAARAPSLTAEAPAAKIAVMQASGGVRLSGAGAGWGGEVRIASARLRDTSTPLRFQPLLASGAVRLSQHDADAALAISLAQGRRPLGPLHLVQRFDTGDGMMTLDAPALAFAPDGLQPAMVLPALAPFGTEVKGDASAGLHLAWGKAGAAGDARFRTTGLDLKSPAGPVKGLSTDLVISSLDPLTTAPGQRIHVQALQTLLPLTDMEAVVRLAPQALELASAQATLGGGRVSLDAMRVPLKPGAAITGVARAQGVQVAPLLEAVNLSRALKLQAVLDGVLPFSLGPDGLHFSKGELKAQGPGRLTLVRSALTGVAADGGPAGAPPSAAQDFAFQALEDLAFTDLDARVNSQPGGRLGVLFHIKGRHDPKVGRPARVGLLDLLRGRAFAKTIPLPKGTQVDLTLDTSLNFDDLYKAYVNLGHATPVAPAGSAAVQP